MRTANSHIDAAHHRIAIGQHRRYVVPVPRRTSGERKAGAIAAAKAKRARRAARNLALVTLAALVAGGCGGAGPAKTPRRDMAGPAPSRSVKPWGWRGPTTTTTTTTTLAPPRDTSRGGPRASTGPKNTRPQTPARGGDFWRRLAKCESPSGHSGRYIGYFQFSADTAAKVGIDGSEDYETQRAAAESWSHRVNPSSTAGWPRCWKVANS